MSTHTGNLTVPFSLNELKQDRQTSVIHHKLAGFADVGLEVIGAAPCDEASR